MAKIKDPETNRKFIEFIASFSKKLDEVSRKRLERVFQENTFVLSNKGNLKKPGEIFFPEETLKYATKDFQFVETVHAVLSKTAEKEWLQARGVKTLSLEHLIKMANESQEELPQFTLCLFAASARFDEAALKKLRQLKVLVSNNEILPAEQTYLSDAFNPKERLESYLGAENGFLLHPAYYTELAVENPGGFKAFLEKMGVSTQLTKDNLAQVIGAANQCADPDSLIQVTLIIFSKFFQDREVAEDVLKNMRSLKLVCKNAARLVATECYLADCYSPQEKIEALVPDLACVSDRYRRDDIDTDELRIFFLALGVQEAVKLHLPDDLQRSQLEKQDPAAEAYFKYIEHIVADLFSWNQRNQRDQYYLAGVYVQISFVNSLVSTRVFWQCLLKHWSQFEDKLNLVTCGTSWSKKAVPSNIHYLVDLAIKKSYGDDKSITDFFGHEVRRILQEYIGDFPVADITEDLSLAQLRLLGFKVDLSLEQCQFLLNAIEAVNKPEQDFEKIVFIYDNLLRLSQSPDLPGSLRGLRLLNRNHQFVEADVLHYIVGDHLPDSENPYLIKKPAKLTTQEFQSICQLMGVRLIKFSELQPKPSLQGEFLSDIGQNITARLEYIISAVAIKNDWVGEDRKSKSADLLRDLQEKLGALSFICAQQFSIDYSDFLREPCDLWVDAENKTIYHLPIDKLDHQAKQTLYEFLFSYFGLACDDKDFLSIMTSPVEKLKTKYAHRLAGCDFEVKTSTSDKSEIEVMYSAGEWQQMQEDSQSKGRSHRLFVVKASVSGGDITVTQPPIKINLLAPEESITVSVTEMKKVSLRF